MLQDYVVKVVLTCWSRLAPRLYRRFAPHVLLLGADMLIAGTLAGCWYLLSKACLAPRLMTLWNPWFEPRQHLQEAGVLVHMALRTLGWTRQKHFLAARVEQTMCICACA